MMDRNQGSGDSEDRPPVVLGSELARAHQVEATHRGQHGDEGSPLADLTYDRWSGELDLARFRPTATDESIRAWLSSWTATQAAASARERLTMTDFYTLLAFARRATVRSVRETDAIWSWVRSDAIDERPCDQTRCGVEVVALWDLAEQRKEIGAEAGIAEVFLEPLPGSLGGVAVGSVRVEARHDLGGVEPEHGQRQPEVEEVAALLALEQRPQLRGDQLLRLEREHVGGCPTTTPTRRRRSLGDEGAQVTSRTC